jgi:alkanesulfonate monooxygenase SsuD/methylene tetrahydromethanopterin reductase-like flavin-dependent oxidoreductase (luciferase family)
MTWFGVFFPQLRMSFPTIEARVLAAEAAGFRSAWFMDHLAAPAAPDVDTFEGWVLAAAIAARTSTIRLGHLVTCDPFRHPAVLAKMAATLDVISEGRLDLGIGWGSVEAELRAFGVTADAPARRAARLRESLLVMRRMFRGERFDFDGDFFVLRDAIGRPVPLQQPLPIHIGGGGERLTMPLVREFAHSWNCPSYAVERFAELRELAAPARVTMQRPIGLAPTAAAREDVAELAGRRFGAWGGLVTGTADEVAMVLRDDVARGVEGFILQFHDFGTPATLELFMRDVAPAV